MLEIISIAAAGAAGVVGYTQSRGFVRRKLRFVEAAQKSTAPVIAGLAAVVVAAPIVSILPFVGGVTAVIFGASVAWGVSSGAKDIRNRRYLTD